MNILAEIIENKRGEIAERKTAQSLHTLEAFFDPSKPPPDFVAALRVVPIGLIAEVKRKSPSAGIIREPFDPAGIARIYETAGAQAVSCLMDGKYFGGGETQWKAVREAVALPMLYKEFVIDSWQILHAGALGASAVLLIVAALSAEELKKFIRQVEALGMTALVEAHTREEVFAALEAGATCLGVNNRNLKTFETRIETSLELRALVPESITFISESGIRTAEDVRRLREAGVNAILVGESLLRQSDPAAAIRNLMNFR